MGGRECLEWFVTSQVGQLSMFSAMRQSYNITLDPRLTLLFGGIFPRPATTQQVYQGIEWFSHLAGLQ